MPRPATGQLIPLAFGRFGARIRVDPSGVRKRFVLTGIPRGDENAASERAAALAEIAGRVLRAGHGDKLLELLKMAAQAPPGPRWEGVLRATDRLASGAVEPLADGTLITVKTWGEDWRSGELHRRFPDHVRPKDSKRDEEIARLYVDDVIGALRVSELTLDDCEEVMSKLPPRLSPASRRHVAQYLRRLLGYAVYPGKLREANPIPKGWLPRLRDKKAKELLFPDEDRSLLGCTDVPLVRRLAYGFLAREGMRADELGRLTWSDVDVLRGRVSLEKNKTDDPRSWDLDPGVTRALIAWRILRTRNGKPPGEDERVFATDDGPLRVAPLARLLRRDLQTAGVKRPQLFARTATRQPIRAHDLRATFVTVSLAIGKSEKWVCTRTGHKSHAMVARYTRSASTWNLGPLDALDEALPELAALTPASRPAPAPEGAPAVDGQAHASGHAGASPAAADGQELELDAAALAIRSGRVRAAADSGEAISADLTTAAAIAEEPEITGSPGVSRGGPSGARSRDLRIKSPCPSPTMSSASDASGPNRGPNDPPAGERPLSTPLRVALAGLATLGSDVVATDGAAEETAAVLRALQTATAALLALVPAPAPARNDELGDRDRNVIDLGPRRRGGSTT